MGTYFTHDLDPATVGRKTELERYISTEDMMLALSDVGTGETDYAPKQAVLDAIIEDAEETAHSYCRRWYTIPLDRADPPTDPPTDAPPELLKAIGAIIANDFWTRGGAAASEAVRAGLDDAIKWLGKVADHKVRINSAQATATPTQFGSLITSSEPRRITWDTMPQ